MDSMQRLFYAIMPCILLMASLLATTEQAIAQQIDTVDAEFAVKVNNKKAYGKNTLKIKQEDGNYRINFALEHRLFSFNQEAHFTSGSDCKVTPIDYKETTRRVFGGKEETQYLNFDWENQVARYQDNDEEKEFSLEEKLYDPISFFFEARCALIQGDKELAFPLIRKGDKKTQRYRVTGTETIETALGNYEALVVERQRKSKKRQTRLYVAPELGYLLVKIEHRENRLLSVTAVLEKMDYSFID